MLNVSVVMGERLDTRDVFAKGIWRVDKNEPISDIFVIPQGSGFATLFIRDETYLKMLKELIAGSELNVRAGNNRVTRKFYLRGSTRAINKVINDCAASDLARMYKKPDPQTQGTADP